MKFFFVNLVYTNKLFSIICFMKFLRNESATYHAPLFMTQTSKCIRTYNHINEICMRIAMSMRHSIDWYTYLFAVFHLFECKIHMRMHSVCKKESQRTVSHVPHSHRNRISSSYYILTKQQN